MQSQIANVANDTTHAFIMTGINDVTVSFRDNANYIGFPKDRITSGNYISNDYTTTCNAFESCIQLLLQKNNNMKIYFLIEPTIDYSNYFVYNMCFAYLKFIANKYGVNVIDFRQMFRKYYEPYSSQYFFDKVHPNEAGYNLMFTYFKNHVRYNINDNFAELPECMIVDYDINFGSGLSTAQTSANKITELIGQKCPLWQQSFQTIVISSKDWGATPSKVAKINYIFNYGYGRMEINSLLVNSPYSFTYYFTSNKYDSSANNVIVYTPNIKYNSKDVTNAIPITTIQQINQPRYL